WSDDWLDRLLAFHAGCRVPATAPADDDGWARLAGLAAWSGRAGLADEWLVRGPSWWKQAMPAARSAAARAALVAHGSLREAWQGPKSLAPAWGEAVAAWFVAAAPDERLAALAGFLKAAAPTARLPFLTAALKALPAEAAGEALARLRAATATDTTILLPLEVRGAVAA